MTLKREEIKRKIIHLGNSVIPLSYYFFIEDRMMMVWILLFISIIFVFIDFFRFRINWLEKYFHMFFNTMLRKHELDGKLTGATWVLAGSTITVFLFNRDIAVLSLLFMSIGDTVAALVGQKYGKIKIGSKSLEGFVGGLIACILVSPFFPSITWLNKIIGSFSASLVELCPLPFDDNLVIPVISGSVMTYIRSLGL